MPNPYDDLLQQDTAERARTTMMSAVDHQPDTEAKLQGLAKQYGMPVDAVRLRQPEVEKRARLDALDYDTLAKQYPMTAGRLTDPAFAAVAHDDADNMSALERVGSGLKGTAKYLFSAPDTKNTLMGDVGAGFFRASRGAAGMFQAPVELAAPALDWLEPVTAVGGNPLRRLAEGFAAQGLAAEQQAALLSPKQSGVVAGGVSSGVQSLVQNLLTLPMALVPGGQGAALGSMAGMTGGQSYQDAREKGLPMQQALPFAASQAAIEYATEKIPVSRLIGDLASNATLRQVLTRQLAAEIPGEQVATVLQDLNEWAILNPDKPFSGYLAERPGAAIQTLIATAVGVGGNVAVMSALEKVTREAGPDDQSSQQAQQNGQVLGELVKLAEASKLRERSPENFATFAQSLAEGGVENLHIEAKTLMQSPQFEAIAQALPSVAEQIQEAAVRGGDIVVPTQEFLSAVPGSEFAQELVDLARTSEDAMSPVEARTFMQERGTQLQAQIEEAVAAQQESDTWRQSRDQLQADFVTQLNTVKRFTPDANEQYASLMANFYAVQASRLGTTPQELAQRYGLVTRADGVAGGRALDQRAYHGTPHRGIGQFDTAHIGKGEGNQAFGWGLYFAGKKEVAEFYRKGLSDITLRVDGGEFNSDDPAHRAAAHVFEAKQNGHTRQDVIDRLTRSAEDLEGRGKDWAMQEAVLQRAEIKLLQDGKALPKYEEVSGGQLYEVDIPEDSDMLHFDKPITSQPANVKQVLKDSGLWKELKDNLSDFGSPSNTRGKLNGENIYAYLAWKLGSEKAASEKLLALGIPGLKYPGGTISGVKNVGHNYVIFHGEHVQKTGEFYQQARGSINLPDDLTSAPSIISLFKGADLSTFVHESGHFFLEVQMDLAARIQAQIDAGASVTDGERGILEDARKILDWFDVKGGDGIDPLTEWGGLDLEAKRPMHEQWARGFEAYSFEGNAPSIELQGAFQKFRTWLVSIYKNLKALNVELTDDVRGVMDRMLASEQAIEEAQTVRAMGPLFKTADAAGMTPEEFAAYHAAGGQATQEAVDYLQARGLRDMKWLANAKNRKLKELQKQVAEMRREVRTEVRAEVMRQPVYRAWQFLTGRVDPATQEETPELTAYREALAKWTESRGLTELDAREAEKAALLTQNPDVKGLERGQLIAKNKKQIDINVAQAMLDWEKDNTKPVRPPTPEPQGPDAALYGKLDADELTTRYGAKGWQRLADFKMTRKAGGLPSDIVAEASGFGSGDEMVKALLEARPPQEMIEAMTDQRMLERFGDLGTPDGLQRAVDVAIHNEARARFVATEIKALERGASVREPGASGRSTVDVLAAAAKAHARRIIGMTKVRDLKPGRYTAAEARAARAAEKAMIAGKTEDALAEKRNQLINLQMAKATMDARDDVDRAVRYLRKFSTKPKSLDADYYDQIASLLNRYDLANIPLRSIDKRKSLAAWVESQREQGMEPEIPPELMDESRRQSFKDLSFDELQGLRDTVRQIEKLGRLKNTLLTAKKNRDFEAVRDEIAASVVLHADGRSADTRTPSTVLGRKLLAVKNFGAAHIKAATWARIFDGGKDGGPMWEYFIRPANDAANMETTMRAEATEKLHAILAPVIKAGRMDGKGTFFPSIGRAMNREQVFAMALNMGNEGNIQRMLDGEGWTVDQIRPVVATLSSADWRAVQAVWDHFESYRPMIGAKERRIYGKEPAWVDPMPLLMKASDGVDVTMRGGYYPVKYDPLANNRAEQHADAEDAKRQMQAAYTSATTRRGFTKARVEAVKGRPLLYSLAAIYSNTNDVIHDLAFHEWLIDVNKLLRSDKINDTIRETYGPAAVKQLKTWIEDTARGEQGLQAELDSMLGRLRQGVSIAGLGFNVMSAAIQPIGITQSVVRVGGKWIGRGVAQYLSNPMGKAREVNGRSDFMAARARTRFRELNELRNQVEGEHPARTWMSNAAFYMMTRMQMTVDVPTWLGAYEKAISEGNADDRAVSLADQAVIDSQGGGQLKDQSAIERGGPAQKLFTVFYSFFNTALNVGVAQGMTEKSKAKLMADYLLLYSVPAVLTVALKDALTPGDSGDWDDMDEILRKLLEAQLDQLFGLMVGVREVAGAAKMALGLSEYAKDYQGPAGLRVLADITGLGQQIGQGEIDDAFRKRAINVLGSGLGLPAAQINRTFSGTQALIGGDTMNPAAIAFGYQEP